MAGPDLSGLDAPQRPSGRAPQAKRIRELEKELRRKEKALAETAALLVLNKSPRDLGGRGRRYPIGPFASLEEARRWVAEFVRWYNTEHRHRALRFVTPDDRHFGREEAILAARAELYKKVRARRPERWANATRDWTPLGTVHLNPESRPRQETEAA